MKKLPLLIAFFSLLLWGFPLFGQIDPNFQVSFQINEDFLVGQALTLKGSDCYEKDYLGRPSQADFQKEVKDLKNTAWEISPIWYNFITGRSGEDSNFLAFTNIRQKKGGLEEFLDNVKQTPQFQAILKRTIERKEFCRQQWEKNLALTYKAITEETGLHPTGNFLVYIGYPAFQGGHNYGEGAIMWGGLEMWPNYTTIYVWHEIFHSILPGQGLKTTDLDHALIQLITDNELNARLNGFSYPPFEGHDSLVTIETKILPFWKDFLKQPKKDLFSFRRSLVEEKKIDQ